MGMAYCTVNDVANTAVKYRSQMEGYAQSEGQVTIRTDQIEELIAESSDIIRSILSPRYEIAVIDALDPLPAIVVSATKVQAALLLYYRFGSVNAKDEDRIIANLMMQLQQYKRTIGNGLLLDSDSTEIEESLGVTLLQGEGSDLILEVLDGPSC